jgi:hypothetical protein
MYGAMLIRMFVLMHPIYLRMVRLIPHSLTASTLLCLVSPLFADISSFRQLPFADSSLRTEVGLQVRETEASVPLVQPIFSAGQRVWKSDLGPIRPGTVTAVSD